MAKFLKLFFAIGIVVLSFNACSSEMQKDDVEIIMDEAYILDADNSLKKQYSDFNEYILIDFDIDFRVITTVSEEDINIFTNKRFNQIKSRSTSGKTILLVINTIQDMTRIEVSMALEHIYTDAFISYIERVGMGLASLAPRAP